MDDQHRESGHLFDASPRSTAFHVLGILGLVTLAFALAVLVRDALIDDPTGALGDGVLGGLVVVFCATLLFVAVYPPLRTLVAAQREHIRTVEGELHEVLAQRAFGDRLTRALEVADTESAVMRVTARALSELHPDREVSLLLADPNEPKVRWHVEVVDGGLGTSTPVDSHAGCVALRTGHTVAHSSTVALDACPHTSMEGPGSSVCVPVDVLGDNVVVLHVVGRADDLPALRAMQMLEALADRVGHRLASLRSGSTPASPNSIDPLTGLLNRRTLEDMIYGLVRDLIPFAVAWCDVDELARYNDERGYEAGDRSLRLVAQVLREGVRPGDMVGRMDGDEFVVIFPNCSALSAAAALERMRDSLVLFQHGHDVAPFTMSAGVADSNQGTSIEEILGTAQQALDLAKRDGRNRVRLAGADSTDVVPD